MAKDVRLAKCFLIISLLIFAGWLLTVEPNIGRFGLIASYYPYVFISPILAIMAIFLLISRNNYWLLAISLMIIVLFIWLGPIVIEKAPRFLYGFKTLGFTDFIIRKGTVEPSNWNLWYHNWPGFFILSTAFIKVAGLNDMNRLLIYYPLFLNIFIIPIVFYVVHKFSSVKMNYPGAPFLACVILFIANITNQDYYSAQSYAYCMLLVFVGLLVSCHQFRQNLPWYRLLVLVVGFAIIISHILTAIIAWLFLFLSLLAGKKSNFKLFLIIGLLICAWMIYGAVVYFDAHLAGFIESFFDVTSIWKANIDDRLNVAPELQILNYVKICFAIGFGLLGLWGCLVVKNEKKERLLIFMGVSLPIITFLNSYGGELLIRVYLLSLMFTMIFSLGLLKKRYSRLALLLLLMIALPFHILIHYGSEKTDLCPHTTLAGKDFFERKAINSIILGGYPVYGTAKYPEKFRPIPWTEIIRPNNKVSLPTNKTKYSILDSIDDMWWDRYISNLRYKKNANKVLSSDNNNLFYHNGNVYMLTSGGHLS